MLIPYFENLAPDPQIAALDLAYFVVAGEIDLRFEDLGEQLVGSCLVYFVELGVGGVDRSPGP